MAAIARPFIGIAAIFFLAAGILLELFVILSGVGLGLPTNLVYFLQSTTNNVENGVADLPNPARWTYFALCGENDNGRNANCFGAQAAFPFDPVSNFGTSDGLDADFVDNSNQYFLMSRFAWAFFLIALVFAVIALLLSVTSLCFRLGAYLTGFTSFLGLLFMTAAAALMTAWAVMGRDAFTSAGEEAELGAYGFGFTWASMAAYLLATVLFCAGGRVGKDNSGPRNGGYFGRKRHSASTRGSFRDSESGRVKEEYE